jgi:ribonuclease P protein component
VYRGGRRSGDHLFAVNALPNNLGFARLGMSVSTKSAGNSVRRNRVRRLIRELFRLRHAELPSLDYVVTSRPGVREADRVALRGSLDRLFKDATRKAMAVKPLAH